MMSVERMGDQNFQDAISHYGSARLSVDEGPLVFSNLPARPSTSEWEPSRLSYYNGNERFTVPFKWEVAPGKAIEQAESPDQSPLILQPPPSASNSPLNPVVPPSMKDRQKAHLPSKFRNYNPADFGISVGSNRSSGSTTTVDSSSNSIGSGSGNGGIYRVTRDKGSLSRRSEFDWPEVSDDESSTTRTTDDQEAPSVPSSKNTRRTGKLGSFSFSFSSFSSNSSQSPLSQDRGGRSKVEPAGGSVKDLYERRNVLSFAAPSAASPTSGYHSARGSTVCSSDEDESEDDDHDDDHVRPRGGFLSCMPLLSKAARIFQSQLRDQLRMSNSDRQVPAAINCSTRPAPGMKNRGYRQSL